MSDGNELAEELQWEKAKKRFYQRMTSSGNLGNVSAVSAYIEKYADALEAAWRMGGDAGLNSFALEINRRGFDERAEKYRHRLRSYGSFPIVWPGKSEITNADDE